MYINRQESETVHADDGKHGDGACGDGNLGDVDSDGEEESGDGGD